MDSALSDLFGVLVGIESVMDLLRFQDENAICLFEYNWDVFLSLVEV
jgi:hypothetical protein